MSRDHLAAATLAKKLRAEKWTYDAIAKELMDDEYRTVRGLTVWGVGQVYVMVNGRKKQ